MANAFIVEYASHSARYGTPFVAIFLSSILRRARVSNFSDKAISMGWEVQAKHHALANIFNVWTFFSMHYCLVKTNPLIFSTSLNFIHWSRLRSNLECVQVSDLRIFWSCFASKHVAMIGRDGHCCWGQTYPSYLDESSSLTSVRHVSNL